MLSNPMRVCKYLNATEVILVDMNIENPSES